MSGGAVTSTDVTATPPVGEVLRGELRDQLVGALQRVPEIAGRELTLRPLSGGITNRNFLVDASGTADRWVIRLAGNDTHLLGISREVQPASTLPSRPAQRELQRRRRADPDRRLGVRRHG